MHFIAKILQLRVDPAMEPSRQNQDTCEHQALYISFPTGSVDEEGTVANSSVGVARKGSFTIPNRGISQPVLDQNALETGHSLL